LIFKKIGSEHDFSNYKDFIMDGLLDSFDIVTIVAEIEKRYCIDIDIEDIQYGNFKNIKNLK